MASGYDIGGMCLHDTDLSKGSIGGVRGNKGWGMREVELGVVER
jgi:hypothetical protein